MNIEQVWPEWQVDRLIGKGSYGEVYRCFKVGDEGKEYAAVKVISVPQDDYDADSIGSEGMTGEQSREYYKDITDNFINEIKILEALKDEKHIVNIQDSRVVEKEDGIGWQIFIRMELLTDFNTYASDKTFTAEDVRKLALDLCDALIVCGKKRIVHRDIKPENIFVDAEGNFKLGDFGVAKQLEKTYASMSTKGTYNYMAPEVVASKKYDSRADIYSLGMVMYKLLNNNRLPFLDPEKKLIRFSERQEAFERRIKGEKIPPIPGVDDDLNEAILKACEFRPDDRYRTVEEFRAALAKEKPSSRFVRIVKRHKVVSAIVFLLVLSIISGSCGYAFSAIKAKQSSYPEKAFVLGINKSVVSLNGVGIVSDSTGLRVVYETEGKEEHLFDREAEDIAFNGKQACFSCFNEKKHNCEIVLVDIETKAVSFSYSSRFDMDPVFFDEADLFYFKNKGEGGDDLWKYSFQEKKHTRLPWSCDEAISLWTVEQLSGQTFLIYEAGSNGGSGSVYAVNLNNLTPEKVNPIIPKGKYLCADGEYIYYSVDYEYSTGIFRRTVYHNAKGEELFRINNGNFDTITDMNEIAEIAAESGAKGKEGIQKTERMLYELLYEGIQYEDSNLIPISRKLINNNGFKGVCETVYDVYSQKKHRLVIDKYVFVLSAGEGLFGYYATDDLDEVGYLVPASASEIGSGRRTSAIYPVCKTHSGYSVYINQNGIYCITSSESSPDVISFIKADIHQG